MIPGLGEIADGINAGIYLLRGDYGSAALSLAAMIPIAGCAATAGKFIYKGVKAYKQGQKIAKAIDRAGDVFGIVKKAGNKGIQRITSKAADVIANASQAFSKKPGLAAAGAGVFRGSIPDSVKAGISKMKETPVQKGFNAIYKDLGAGAGKAAEAAAEGTELGSKLRTISTVDEALKAINRTSFTNFAGDDIYKCMEQAICNKSFSVSDLKTVQKAIAENGGWIDKYYYPDMSIKWPQNDGFLGTPTTKDFRIGERFDRYGYENGSFTSPVGSSYDSRALTPGTRETRPYHKYEVVEGFSAREGEIAPWFGKTGGGMQYFFGDDITIRDLLDAAKIKEVFD